MSFQESLGAAWREHAERPAAIVAALPGLAELAASEDDVLSVASLAGHVCGEHLGEWQKGREVVSALARDPRITELTRAAFVRHGRALALCADAATALDDLSASDQAWVLAYAGGALGVRGDLERAQRYLDRAEAAAGDLADDDRAVRALAIAGNNLSCALEETTGRSAAQNALMLRAADLGLVFWRRAGTWVEETRAHYRVSAARLAAGEASAALEAAREAEAVCLENKADAAESFWSAAQMTRAAHAAGEPAWKAYRAQAQSRFDLSPAETRTYRAGELEALAALG